ncbi:thiol-disulfide isomerase [Candidatus Woesearchaeota archaeon]|nr:MAG: thiol-disulfide isomerase [Candidatus Woesearchaeota archaeon]
MKKKKTRRTTLLIAALLLTGVFIIYLEEPRPRGTVETVTPAVQKSGTLTPELAGIAAYLNTQNITLGELVGKKVILVDIWTYSCINCQRTLPYITAWHEKYKDLGLEIIGVHSPEFDFEKNPANVARAVEKWGIQYPVVLDNDHATWRAFRNNYWPRKYLIDIDGYIAYDHIGEGAYDETERKIQELLQERQERLGISLAMPLELSTINAPTVNFRQIGTPEIYLGSEFTRGNFGSPEGLPHGKTITYFAAAERTPNNVYLEGTWTVGKDHVRLESDTGKVHLQFTAKNANIVAGGPSNVTTYLNGEQREQFRTSSSDLYPVAMEKEYGTYDLTLDVTGKGFELYTFTFG